MFKRIPLFVKVYVNEIEVIRLDKKMISFKRKADPVFSSSRLLVADFNAGQILLGLFLTTSFQAGGWSVKVLRW
jgi:hypothetical protein